MNSVLIIWITVAFACMFGPKRLRTNGGGDGTRPSKTPPHLRSKGTMYTNIKTFIISKTGEKPNFTTPTRIEGAEAKYAAKQYFEDSAARKAEYDVYTLDQWAALQEYMNGDGDSSPNLIAFHKNFGVCSFQFKSTLTMFNRLIIEIKETTNE